MRPRSIDIPTRSAAQVVLFNHIPAILLSTLVAVSGCAGTGVGALGPDSEAAIQVGTKLPDSLLVTPNGNAVRLTDTTGLVKLINVVPTLKTLMAESQTRHLSEALSSLDGTIERVTVNANSVEDQASFAKLSGIRNMTFVSDAPQFAFGSATGLWLRKDNSLQRAVIVTNRDNVVQYVEMVPAAQMPNYDRLYQVVRKLAGKP